MGIRLFVYVITVDYFFYFFCYDCRGPSWIHDKSMAHNNSSRLPSNQSPISRELSSGGCSVVRVLEVELAHMIIFMFFLDLFQDLTGIVLSVVDDIPVDRETSVWLRQSRDHSRLSLFEILIGVWLRACILKVYMRLRECFRLYCLYKKTPVSQIGEPMFYKGQKTYPTPANISQI